MSNTVLICDDAIFMRSVLRQVLENLGYEVAGEAASGREAVDMYKELRPDLVTMDMVMPDVGGVEAVEQIIKIDPKARIVMCSAMGQELLVQKAMTAGAIGYVVKPFKPEDIEAAVHMATAAAA